MTVSELRRALFELDDQSQPVVVACDQLTACEPFDLGRVVGVELVDGMAVLQVASPEAEESDGVNLSTEQEDDLRKRFSAMRKVE